MKKRILSMLLVVAMIVSMASVAFAAPIENYTDVEKDTWYYEYVKDVVTEGYYIGYSDTAFGPEDHMTRAQMVIVLARLAGVTVDGEEVNKVSTVFTDVPSGTWYSAAVKWAYDNGITTGITPTEFWPNVDVSREDACTFIIRYLGFMAKRDNVSFDHMKDSSRIFNFMDEASIRDYSAAAVDECMAYGMVWGDTGDETGHFYPQHSWRRCEGAKMISILADILESGRSNWTPPTPPTPPTPGTVTYNYSLVYHVTTDGTTWDVWAGKAQTDTRTVEEGAAAPVVNFTVTSEVPASYTVGGTTYNFVGWTRINDGTADADCAAGQTVSVEGNGSVTLYAVYEAEPIIPVPNTFKLVYSVDGKTDVIAAQTYEGTETEHTFDVTDVATYDIYSILGWDTDAAADAVVYTAEDTVTVAANGEVTLYAVLVPLDDYVKLGVLDAIDSTNEYLAKAEELVVSAGSHDVTVGNYVSAEEVSLNVKTNTVRVAVTGELYSGTVADVIALATEYAVAILGPENVPTKSDVKDIVEDVAGSVGVEIDGKTAQEIAEEVYDKVHAIGADIFGNFRNYKGGFCVNKITLKNGGKNVASLNVTNDKGLTTDGAAASKAAAKELAIAVAKAMYGDLKTQSGSEITLNASIVVEFTPNYVSTYNDTYTLDLAVTLKSDMYRYDGATNTLYLVVTDELQEQYSETIDSLLTATLENGTVQGKLTSLVEDAVKKSGLVDNLGSLAEKDAVEAALKLWVAANLKAEVADPADTPFEFLWTKEGTIVEEKGVYSTSTGTVLGDNAALYALVETVYASKLDDMIADVDVADLSGDVITAINKLVGADKVAVAFAGWQAANGKNALDSETAYTLYNFLSKGGKINADYTQGNLTDKKMGVNDSLYTLYVELTNVATESAMEEAENNLGAGWANATPEEKIIVVKIAVDSVISSEDYVAFTGSIREYLLNMCMAKAANDLGVDASKYEAKAEEQKAPAYALIDEMLAKGLYNAVAGSDYAEYVGLDEAGRADKVDQMILKALATATVKGKTLGEYMALAVQFKAIERMADVRLENVATLLNNATFQKVVAQYGDSYIHYLATAITKLPAKASVTIDGVVISEASLAGVKAAAAKNDTAAVCTELAKIINQLGHLTMNKLENDPLEITVKYGVRTATMNFGLIIE